MPDRVRRPLRAAVLAAGLTSGLVLTVGAPAAFADAPPSAPPTSAYPRAAGPHVVPPPAPTPSAAGRSPSSPDPHPPMGGIGPNGEYVGGEQLQGRGIITPPAAPALPDGLTATAWTLVDLDTGKILAARDPHGRYQPASILKTLTCVTLIPLLPGDKIVTPSAQAAGAEGSAVGIVAGGKYTVDELFQGLLMVSGNDTAAALAEAAGGVSHTVQLMNAKALSLGAYDTFVQTPSGLDGWQQLTSAYDMSLFLRAAVNLPRFVAYDQTRTATIPAQNANGKALNAFQIQSQSTPFMTKVPGALVAKTGFTDAAQHTYVAATERNGHRLGVVFMRAQRWPLDQWQQAAKLFDWGYALAPTVAAVGHLDDAVVTPAQAAQSSQAAATKTAALRKAEAAAKANSQWRQSIPIAIIGLGVIIVSVVMVRRRPRKAAPLSQTPPPTDLLDPVRSE